MSRTLTGTITDRALETFERRDIKSPDFYEVWFNHWITAGEEFYKELIAENLIETAKKVREIIDWNKECNKP